MTEWKGIVRRAGELDPNFDLFTPESLAEHDGTVVPLTLEPGGPVIGEVTLQYDAGEQALRGDFKVDDPKVAKILKMDPPSIFG